MTKNIVIIAPHPDDEVLGCGATMSKLSKAGHSVYVLIASRGSARIYNQERVEAVRLEALQAHQLLGVKNTFFLEYPAPELDTVPLADIARDIAAIISQLQAEIIYLPHRGDIHNDHRIVFNASLVAARPVGNYSVKEIYTYETLSETEWAAPFGDDAFIPTCYVNIEDTFLTKLNALDCFKSQIKDFPNPRSLENVEALAKHRGATVGVRHAEAFMLIRKIID